MGGKYLYYTARQLKQKGGSRARESHVCILNVKPEFDPVSEPTEVSLTRTLNIPCGAVFPLTLTYFNL